MSFAYSVKCNIAMFFIGFVAPASRSLGRGCLGAGLAAVGVPYIVPVRGGPGNNGDHTASLACEWSSTSTARCTDGPGASCSPDRRGACAALASLRPAGDASLRPGACAALASPRQNRNHLPPNGGLALPLTSTRPPTRYILRYIHWIYV